MACLSSGDRAVLVLAKPFISWLKLCKWVWFKQCLNGPPGLQASLQITWLQHCAGCGAGPKRLGLVNHLSRVVGAGRLLKHFKYH